MKTLPKLTKKQRGFVKDYVRNKNGAGAVMANYNVKNSTVAASIAAENLKKPYIVEAIEVQRKSLKQTLIDRGVDEKKIAEKIEILLEATDEHGQRDYTAIDKGLKHATAIYGVSAEQNKQLNNVTYNFIFSEEVQEKVRLINEEIKARLISRN